MQQTEDPLLSIGVVSALCNFLTPATFLLLHRSAETRHFAAACTRLGKTPESHFREHLHRALLLAADAACDCAEPELRAEHVEQSVATVFDGLDTHQHWLTGGFVLAVLRGEVGSFLKETTAAADIDILTYHSPPPPPHPDAAPFVAFPVDENEEQQSLSVHFKTPGPVPTNGGDAAPVDNWDDYGSPHVRHLTHYTWGGKRIVQFIQLAPGTLEQHVAHYDFSFCRNAYGGAQRQLIVMDLDAIIAQRCKVLVPNNYLLPCIFARESDMYTMATQKFFRATKRIRKYMRRGYTIHLDGFGFGITYNKALSVIGRDLSPAQEDVVRAWGIMWFETTTQTPDGSYYVLK